MQVTRPAALDVFLGQKPGFGDQVFGGTEEFTIKMGNIIKKVAYQAPNSLFWLNIFLSAYVTISSGEFSITVQTNFLVTFFEWDTCEILLKNKERRYFTEKFGYPLYGKQTFIR